MPFAGYKDFADCVRRNRDKDDPQAYCASIQRQAENGHHSEKQSAPEHAEPESAPKANQHTGWWKGHL